MYSRVYSANTHPTISCQSLWTTEATSHHLTANQLCNDYQVWYSIMPTKCAVSTSFGMPENPVGFSPLCCTALRLNVMFWSAVWSWGALEKGTQNRDVTRGRIPDQSRSSKSSSLNHRLTERSRLLRSSYVDYTGFLLKPLEILCKFALIIAKTNKTYPN